MFTRIIHKAIPHKLFSYSTIALVVISLILGLLTYLSVITTSSGMLSGFTTKLIIIDIIFILLLGALIWLRVLRILHLRNIELFSFKFRTKLILSITAVSILPAIIVMIISFSFFHHGTKLWFDDKINRSLEESLEISDIYINEHKKNIADDLFHMKKYTERNTNMILTNSSEFEHSFAGQAAMLSLTEAVIFFHNAADNSNKILSRTSFSFFPSVENLDFKKKYVPNDLGHSLIFNEDDNYIRIISSLDTIPNTYILVGRLINDKVVRHIKNARGANSDYSKMRSDVLKMQKQFVVIFALIIILLILAIILLGVFLASRFLGPLFKIIDATGKIGEGNYDVKIDESTANGEILSLVRSFNKMTELIAEKNNGLNFSNQVIDTKKKFFESVLGSMPAAILVTDINKKIKLFNKAAKQIFEIDNLSNQDLCILMPMIQDLINKVESSPDAVWQGDAEIVVNEQQKKLYVYITLEKSNEEISGYIFNICEISPVSER